MNTIAITGGQGDWRIRTKDATGSETKRFEEAEEAFNYLEALEAKGYILTTRNARDRLGTAYRYEAHIKERLQRAQEGL